MTIEIAKITLPPTQMVLEGSWRARPVGQCASTMTLYADAGSYMIEWDIPDLERTEQIGLTFEHKTLVDYDGVMSLPREAVKFLRDQGFTVPKEFED